MGAVGVDQAALDQLAPAVDGTRLTLHVLAAAVWVGGQFTLAGLVPTARRLGEAAPGALARAFARIQWPAYAVLLATGIWNVAADGSSATTAWKTVLGVKIGVVLLAGVGAWLHSRARSRSGLATWGAVSALSSVAALTMGVFLAG
jgi:putative copper export protein